MTASEHPLPRAREYSDLSFKHICHFLKEQQNITLSAHDLKVLDETILAFYDNYSKAMQLRNLYAGLPPEHNIIPLRMGERGFPMNTEEGGACL